MNIIEELHVIYMQLGIAPESTTLPVCATGVALSLILMYIVYLLFRRFLEPLITKLMFKSEAKWDDILFRKDSIKWISLIVPLMIGELTLPASFAPYPTLSAVIKVILDLSLVITITMLVIETVKSVFLLIADRDNIDNIVEKMHQARANDEEFVYQPSHSLKGLQQMIIIVIIVISAILCISILFSKDPLLVVSGLSAAAAIIMLVFQDSILGVVAGVQLTANDMLQPGDWIVAPKYQANGIVREVTLAAVKVQNWDKTIVTIPPYHLLSEGFQNWRGMQQSKGRRIARSINIDINTVRYATESEIEAWSQQVWWRAETATERPVNLTALRMYLEHYITTLPTLRSDMLYMIRELQPTAEGLPIELYLFTSKTDWKSYEAVQAGLLDQVLAIVPRFGLRVYQRPSGADIQMLRN